MAVADIGAVAALAFADPARFAGQTLAVAGDELTPREIANTIAAELGIAVTYHQLPVDAARATVGDAVADSYAWINQVGDAHEVDIAEARALHPAALTFADWLHTTGKTLILGARASDRRG